jgi:hypothetical protein
LSYSTAIGSETTKCHKVSVQMSEQNYVKQIKFLTFNIRYVLEDLFSQVRKDGSKRTN